MAPTTRIPTPTRTSGPTDQPRCGQMRSAGSGPDGEESMSCHGFRGDSTH